MNATETPIRLFALVNVWFWFLRDSFSPSSLSPPLFSDSLHAVPLRRWRSKFFCSDGTKIFRYLKLT